MLAALKGWETCALSLWNHNRFVSSTRKTVSYAPALFYCLFYTLYLQETVFMAENAVAKPTILIRKVQLFYTSKERRRGRIRKQLYLLIMKVWLCD